MSKILIIEDDKLLSDGLFKLLNSFQIDQAFTLRDSRHLINKNLYDLILLDLNLPDGDGIRYCKDELSMINTPVIMLIAKDLIEDETQGLLSGAEDYITKPFSPEVLKLRIDKILKRMNKRSNSTIVSGDISFNPEQHLVYRDEVELKLSQTEYKLLKLLITNIDIILLKEIIMERIWKDEPVDDNTLSVNIRRLRSKIESDPKKPKHIKTVHGMGYTWKDI